MQHPFEVLFKDQTAAILSDLGVDSVDGLLKLAAFKWNDGASAEGNVHRIRQGFAKNGDFPRAIRLTRAMLEQWTLRGDEEQAFYEHQVLGVFLDKSSHPHAAREHLQRAYDGFLKVDPRGTRLASVAHQLGMNHVRADRRSEAFPLLHEALEIFHEKAPKQAGLLPAQLGELYVQRGDLEAAVPLLQEAWENARNTRGKSEQRTVSRAHALATILEQLGRAKDAVPLLRDLVDAKGVIEEDRRMAYQWQLGCVLESQRKREEAFRLIEEVMRYTRAKGEEDPELSKRIVTYSQLLLRRKRVIEAEGLLKEALEIDQRRHGQNSLEVATRYAALGDLYRQLGRRDEALGWLEPAAGLLRSLKGDGDEMTRGTVEQLVELWVDEARLAVDRGDRGYARDVLMRALPIAEPVLGVSHHLVQDIQSFQLV